MYKFSKSAREQLDFVFSDEFRKTICSHTIFDSVCAIGPMIRIDLRVEETVQCSCENKVLSYEDINEYLACFDWLFKQLEREYHAAHIFSEVSNEHSSSFNAARENEQLYLLNKALIILLAYLMMENDSIRQEKCKFQLSTLFNTQIWNLFLKHFSCEKLRPRLEGFNILINDLDSIIGGIIREVTPFGFSGLHSIQQTPGILEGINSFNFGTMPRPIFKTISRKTTIVFDSASIVEITYNNKTLSVVTSVLVRETDRSTAGIAAASVNKKWVFEFVDDEIGLTNLKLVLDTIAIDCSKSAHENPVSTIGFTG